MILKGGGTVPREESITWLFWGLDKITSVHGLKASWESSSCKKGRALPRCHRENIYRLPPSSK